MKFRFILILLFCFLVSPLYAASFDCNKATTETEIAVCFDLGYQAFEKDEFQEAFDYWKPLADAGEAHAQYNIAQLYYGNQQSILFAGSEFFKGYGINRNAAREDAVEEAVKWYVLSAKQGVADAQFNLSVIYELEFGDEITGQKWAELAAKNGNINAQWNLYISGSFDCNTATTETEKAICADDYLGSLDKKMANLWKKNPRSDHEILEQKKWLNERDRFLNEAHCKPNNRCLRDDYRFRILELETDCSIEIDVSNLNDGNYPLVELEDVISVSNSFEECRRQSLSKNIDDFEKFSDIFLSISDETCAIAVDAFMYPISERVGHAIMSRCGSDIADLYGLLLDAMVALIKKQNPDFSVSFSEDELRWRSFTEESCEFYSDQFGSDSYRNIDGINQCRRDVLKFRILYLSPLIGVEENRGWPASSIEEVLGPHYGLYRK